MGEQEAEERARRLAERILQAADQVREHVEKSCDYVGNRFAEEARRIHYGETAPRRIYGEASHRETAALDEEGIEYHRLPHWPRRDS